MFSYCIPARDDDDGRDAEAQAGYGCGAGVEAGDGVGKEQDRQWMTSRNGDGTTELRACRVVSKARDSNNRVKIRIADLLLPALLLGAEGGEIDWQNPRDDDHR
ncbi:hypothetical protein R3P38DRAFT_2794715 [Favolaschia claudopus]|uniref:Uncharacterized protein n=1 Tax=Favolaschia claudopus TaxID=2862362 RepID=A0AAW0A9V2_9AGAR